MELARYGILVNALAPGYIETDFNRAFFQTEAGKALIGRIPLKRIGQAPDLDGALLFLASPASAYVTGAVIAVDGGHGVAAHLTGSLLARFLAEASGARNVELTEPALLSGGAIQENWGFDAEFVGGPLRRAAASGAAHRRADRHRRRASAGSRNSPC